MHVPNRGKLTDDAPPLSPDVQESPEVIKASSYRLPVFRGCHSCACLPYVGTPSTYQHERTYHLQALQYIDIMYAAMHCKSHHLTRAPMRYGTSGKAVNVLGDYCTYPRGRFINHSTSSRGRVWYVLAPRLLVCMKPVKDGV